MKYAESDSFYYFSNHHSNESFYDQDEASTIETTNQDEALVPQVINPQFDGKVISGGDDGTIKIFCKRTGRMLANLVNAHQDPVNCIVLLNVQSALFASCSDDCTIKIWSHLDYSLIHIIQIHAGPVLCLKYLPDNKLISASEDGYVKIIRLTENHGWEILSELIGHTNSVEHLELLTNNRLATGSRDNTVRIWDIELVGTPRLIEIIDDFESNIKGLLFLEPFYLATISNDGFAHIYDIDNFIQLTSPVELETGTFESMCCLSHGKIALGCSDSSSIIIWSYLNDQIELLTYPENIGAAKYLKQFDDNIIICGYENGTIVIYDFNNYEIHLFVGHLEEINEIVFDSNKSIMASASDDSSIILWGNDGYNITLQNHIGRVNCIKLVD